MAYMLEFKYVLMQTFSEELSLQLRELGRVPMAGVEPESDTATLTSLLHPRGSRSRSRSPRGVHPVEATSRQVDTSAMPRDGDASDVPPPGVLRADADGGGAHGHGAGNLRAAVPERRAPEVPAAVPVPADGVRGADPDLPAAVPVPADAVFGGVPAHSVPSEAGVLPEDRSPAASESADASSPDVVVLEG